jgi:ABC-type dipeptide/oligopeptide/nickel transport system permease component
VTFVLAVGVIFFNLLADVLSVYVTPRLRTGQSRQ